MTENKPSEETNELKDLVVEKEFNQTLDDLLANPFGSDGESAASIVNNETDAAPRLVDMLTETNKKQALELSKQIEPGNQAAILGYGAPAQAKLHDFSHSMLAHVQKQDVGPIGDIISDLMYRLQEADPDELAARNKNVFTKMFHRVKQSINEITSKYQKIGTQIDRIALKLEHSKKRLMEDNSFLEQLYDKNKDYFQALNIYIAAGELKLEEINTKMLPELRKKAEQTGDQMDYQEVNDLTQFADRLDKRVYDLRLSRQITIQQAPQIRLIQNTNQALAEKIQSSIMTAIPLWKNQVAIALTLLRQQQAVAAQRQVSETTNELLKRNADMLKTNAIETARENERGIVDIETLKETQSSLIETLQETLKIQQEGRAKRAVAEKELVTMEQELKERLLEMK
ncbi:toxic anion resistance protein [Listeria monocytogenes]|uniref:Toxic anion resistance protein n=4 Tax=Listeria TaxID=1637 RepID=A0A7X1A0Y7_9LIST|nr:MULTISPECIES: toxic anion resistance protein [Listeria]EAE1680796.1 toxic anion resistance protein [Listeria monocytogenes LIS0071]EAE3706075.1 toxic anion resistance protein [Listeria monocytogenes serotype 1/2b]EAF3078189.1 toxic anion resistance protein [Listeria monocytogenes serotype 1/2a]EAG6252798.1 toxic anion resistance protein [Listeria monocytogenes CFSAN003806]EAG6262171.1 toxic anion resistance protein [Listeria monocytogenes CFSAN003725]EAG6332156.1 toxic anion resistance pro